MHVALLLTISTMAVVIGHTYSQRETVPQAIARGATGRVRSAPSGLVPSLVDLLRNTDLIVRGTVGEGRAYLSEDHLDVYTDYVLLNPAVLHGTVAGRSSNVPGLIPPLVVTQLGGAVQLGGVTFTQTEDGLPPLRPGMNCLLLLSRVGDKYHIAGTFFGALEVRNEKVFPLGGDAHLLEHRGAPVDNTVRDFLAAMRALGK